ncbi:MAG: 2,3,4,5-tetrahydropyridine-2,6-dicarboxylate N-succinyltransferase [Bacteroidetes bacterium]|jgi:2,3,4,5-tetrahydropyridine-2-carboxylate N-succinyltransferase|nr:2,3,4,5-tetrahydropyridine-2,6-dicarboxylate N-succinyltransferase [Bacteroidota bacterium]
MASDLRRRLTALTQQDTPDPDAARAAFADLLDALNAGQVRAASRQDDGTWTAHAWVKEGILLGFRLGQLTDYSTPAFPFFDKDTYPLKPLTPSDDVRVVPGGSAIRTGAYVAPSVVCMPPMYINVGAYVDAGTMVDSHALVGSCAQIGQRVHLSAAAQIGGVLEPVGARPVIIEDDVFVGGGCGVYEGCLVRTGAVLAPGVQLTGSTRLYDLVHERILTPTEGAPLDVPERAVVVPGTRPITSGFGAEHGLSLYAPVIVKYRDAQTDAATTLEDALR